MTRFYGMLFWFNIGMIVACLALGWTMRIDLSQPVLWFSMSACIFRIAQRWNDR